MKRLTLSSCVFMFACGSGAPYVPAKGISNDAEATQALVAASAAADTMGRGAAPGREIGLNLNASGSLKVKGKCESGTAEANVTVESMAGEGIGDIKATYSWTANACVVNGGEKITGSFTYAAVVKLTDTTFNLTLDLGGAFAYEGPKYAGTFTMSDFELVVSGMGSTLEVSSTGKFNISGKDYTVDKQAAITITGRAQVN